MPNRAHVKCFFKKQLEHSLLLKTGQLIIFSVFFTGPQCCKAGLNILPASLLHVFVWAGCGMELHFLRNSPQSWWQQRIIHHCVQQNGKHSTEGSSTCRHLGVCWSQGRVGHWAPCSVSLIPTEVNDKLFYNPRVKLRDDARGQELASVKLMHLP